MQLATIFFLVRINKITEKYSSEESLAKFVFIRMDKLNTFALNCTIFDYGVQYTIRVDVQI